MTGFVAHIKIRRRKRWGALFLGMDVKMSIVVVSFGQQRSKAARCVRMRRVVIQKCEEEF
jgi:hypothetical protein